MRSTFSVEVTLWLSIISAPRRSRRGAGMQLRGQCDSCFHHLVQDKRHHPHRADVGHEDLFGLLYTSEWCVSIPCLPVSVLTNSFRHCLLPVSAFPSHITTKLSSHAPYLGRTCFSTPCKSTSTLKFVFHAAAIAMKATLTRSIALARRLDYDVFSNVRFPPTWPALLASHTDRTVHPSRVESVLTSRFILSLRTHDSDPDGIMLELWTHSNNLQNSDSHATRTMLVFDQMAGPLDFWDEDEDGCT